MQRNFHEINVHAEAATRPIKVAYFVPSSESDETQWILDSVFYEAYTRWGGTSSLVIPCNKDGFQNESYGPWLTFLDPDFVYSYVDFEDVVVEKISKLCSPISFIRHQARETTRWQSYVPDWHHYFQAVPSLSTLLSPYSSHSRHRGGDSGQGRVLVTQFCDPSEERFLADNFGTRHHISNYTNPVPGLYETLCFVGAGNKGSVKAGTEETKDVVEILARIVDGNVTTFNQLARVHSKDIPKADPSFWSNSFSVFVGQSSIDRIHFWNSRNLGNSWSDISSSLIVRKEAFSNEGFIKSLGAYLNKYNFIKAGNGPSQVTFRSFSVNHAEMKDIRDRFSKFTYNQLELNESTFNQFIFPNKENFERSWGTLKDSKTIKLNDRDNIIEAERPVHFKYTPARYDYICKGDWAVELEIERQNSLSKYSNSVDVWQLPRRRNVPQAFTNALSKVAKNGRLVVIPKGSGQGLLHDENPRPNVSYKLHLPSDETLFRSLVIRVKGQDTNDLRSKLKIVGYDDISISDKGQNLRGIISMFDRFQEAYELLTNSVWRNVLRKFYRKDASTRDDFFGCVPNDFKFKERLIKRQNLKNIGQAVNYLKACFDDTLEYLVEKKVMFQVHKWRCAFCGHSNVLSVDELKKKNSCSVCELEYFSPIDLEWRFKINSFVSDALCERHGLPVLWALGWLHKNCHRGSFYYLPEVDLFQDANHPGEREEIDILCVKEGLFCAIEVKKSATQLTRKPEEVDKFIQKIKILQPDVALLIFEDWSEEPKEGEAPIDKDEVKKAILEIIRKAKDESGISDLEIGHVVACEDSNYQENLDDLGVEGVRSQRILYGE